MIYTENVTPTGLAARLAEYITDPSTIRANVKAHFGRAPSLDQCANLRRAVEKRHRTRQAYSDSAFVVHCKRHSGPYELDEDGYDRCVHCKEERRKADQIKADKAALMAKQLADLRARVERDRKRRAEITEQERLRELAVAEHTLKNHGKPVLFQDLLVAVASAFEMAPADLLGDCRQRVYVDARTALAQILRQRGSSFPMIGKRMKRDHSSIVYLLQGYDFRAKRNPLIGLVVDRLA